MLQTGCTSTGDPERGRGFDDLFRGLANHNGLLRFRSGDAALVIDGQSPSRDDRAGIGDLEAIGIAPFAGAWTETPLIQNRHRLRGVAPFAGAWIETLARSLALPKYRRLTIGPRSARHLRLSRLGYHVGVQC